jgi:transcriptional regulator GlxA family with amidase domain
MTSRSVALLALADVQLLDVAGPLDVFAEANAQCGREIYSLVLVGTAPGPITTSSGRRLLSDFVAPADAGPAFDTLLVAGAPRMHEAAVGAELLAWLRDTAVRCRRYGSVCSGAFLLGQAGLLDGRRVTTHWAVAKALAERFPEAQVEADAICLFDGPLRTAAGVTAGLDLALALVEEDLGAEIARRVAAQLVMFFKRVG